MFLDMPVNLPFLGFADPISSISHLMGAIAGLFGAFFLIHRGWGNGWRVFSLSLYSFCVIFLFSMSAVFHIIDISYTARMVMQRLDHAAIWTMIAGSFTPIHWILFRGPWRWLFLLVMWTLAITGLVLKTVFFYDIPEWLGLSFYLFLGWMGMLSFIKIYFIYGKENLKLLVIGGLAYTVGAVIENLRWPILIPNVLGPHEIFHVCVLMGAYAHWRFIYEWSNHPISNHIRFLVRERPNSIFIAEAIGENIQLHAHNLEKLKNDIQKTIDSKFHQRTPAHSVKLEYLKEEYLKGPTTSL